MFGDGLACLEDINAALGDRLTGVESANAVMF